MKEASLNRAVSYSSAEFPPLPPRRRISATCWERVWWLTLAEPLLNQQGLNSVLQDLSNEKVEFRAQLRTHQRISITIKVSGIDDQTEFQLSMAAIARIHTDVCHIERVEDRLASVWPIDKFF